MQKTIYTVGECFHSLVSRVAWQIVFQYIEDNYTLIIFVYWAWNILHIIILKKHINDNMFIKTNMSKWDDFMTFDEEMGEI